MFLNDFMAVFAVLGSLVLVANIHLYTLFYSQTQGGNGGVIHMSQPAASPSQTSADKQTVPYQVIVNGNHGPAYHIGMGVQSVDKIVPHSIFKRHGKACFSCTNMILYRKTPYPATSDPLFARFT